MVCGGDADELSLASDRANEKMCCVKCGCRRVLLNDLGVSW